MLDPDPDQIKYGSETLKVNIQIRIRINRESRIWMRIPNMGVEEWICVYRWCAGLT